jgi:hypothetical protein
VFDVVHSVQKLLWQWQEPILHRRQGTAAVPGSIKYSGQGRAGSGLCDISTLLDDRSRH